MSTPPALAAWLRERRLVGDDPVDADELAAAIEAAGVTDQEARERYGYPSAFALGEAALPHLRPSRRPAVRRPPRYLPAALARAGSCLVVGLIGLALPWPAAVAAVTLGWAGARAGRSTRSAGAWIPHLVASAGQAVALMLLWRAGPPIAVAAPLLAVPVAEVFAARYASRAAAALDGLDDPAAYRRRLRGLARRTVTALVPPLLAGAALLAAAGRLPYGLSAHPDARATVLGLAAGVLLAGLAGTVAVLRARGWMITAALLASTVPPAPELLIPVYVGALALLTYALLDARSYT